MKSLKLVLGIIVSLLTLSNCERDDNDSLNFCQNNVIISSSEYDTAPDDELSINSVYIIEDCLVINFSSGGCSGDTWELKLIDADIILESYPPQRNLRLSLNNKELCDAYITKEISFGINELQVDGDRVYLNLINSGDQILYEY